MAQISVTFSGDNQDLNDFVYGCGYQDSVVDDQDNVIDNPETKIEFFRRKTKEYVWHKVYGYRRMQASRQAKDNVQYNEF